MSRAAASHSRTTEAVGDRHALPGLTGMRAPAMLLVLLFHSVDNLVGRRLWPLPGAGAVIANASSTLTMFFVLSGYLLTLGWTPSSTVRDFAVRRFARIYPVYAVAWVVAVLVTWWRLDELPSLPVAATTLTLTQSLVPDSTYFFGVDIVFWSLSCEAVFYALLPFVLPRLAGMSPRRLWVALSGCFAWLVLVPLPVHARWGNAGLRVLTQMPYYRGAEFFAGVLACLLVRSGWRPPLTERPALLLTAVGYGASSALLAALWGPANHDTVRLVCMVVTAPLVSLAVVSVATSNEAGHRGWLESRWLVRLGDWSYPAYLFHFPLLLALYPPFHRTQSVPSGLLQLACYLLGVVLLSAAAHARFVAPVERALKRRLLRK
jgi:peptidoglycan/LPS O-acetylase OafA/YrhL